jgi:hypothetical protein
VNLLDLKANLLSYLYYRQVLANPSLSRQICQLFQNLRAWRHCLSTKINTHLFKVTFPPKNAEIRSWSLVEVVDGGGAGVRNLSGAASGSAAWMELVCRSGERGCCMHAPFWQANPGDATRFHLLQAFSVTHPPTHPPSLWKKS